MEREHLQNPDVSWGHEPTPNPSGGGESTSGTLAEFPSWEGSRVGRFMESLHDFSVAHWDHEPNRSRSRPRPRPRNQVGRSRTSSRTRTRTKGRFMESTNCVTPRLLFCEIPSSTLALRELNCLRVSADVSVSSRWSLFSQTRVVARPARATAWRGTRLHQSRAQRPHRRTSRSHFERAHRRVHAGAARWGAPGTRFAVRRPGGLLDLGDSLANQHAARRPP